MKSLLLIIVCIIVSSSAFSQMQNDTIAGCSYCDSLYNVVCPPDVPIGVYAAEKMPEFNGGVKAMFKFLNENISYPSTCAVFEGKVMVKFIVDKDGTIICSKVVKSIFSLLDREALRIVNLMPKWLPATSDGKPVHQCYTLPINFVLNKNS
ncbi:MAG: energy transducer TonB [Prevotellaceae bacterium]|jgi:TonB family protein|nr:energy transducer TonB [Prevotellaceae bacterium]